MKDFLSLKKSKKKLSILLFAALLLFLLLDIYTKVLSSENNIFSLPSLPFSLTYPVLKTKAQPVLTARGVIVMDRDSKVVLFSKNPNLRFSSASTTKIMTFLTAFSFFKLDDTLEIKTSTVEAYVQGFQEGQKFTLENLLYAMLLPSANDAALAISQNYKNGEGDFVREMNINAYKMHLFNTHYGDPIGLNDEENYTTPLDLARLTSIALQNKVFAKIVSTKEKVITDFANQKYVLENRNKLLGEDGVFGVKTGYTQEAGEVLVTSKLENGHTIIIVVMGSEDRFADTKKILDLITGNIIYLPIHP